MFLLLSANSARPKKTFSPRASEIQSPSKNIAQANGEKEVGIFFSFSLRPLRDQKNFFSPG